MIPCIKTILVLTGMTLQTTDKPLNLAMKIMVLTALENYICLWLKFSPLLGKSHISLSCETFGCLILVSLSKSGVLALLVLVLSLWWNILGRRGFILLSLELV
jgi:hypothetical protein